MIGHDDTPFRAPGLPWREAPLVAEAHSRAIVQLLESAPAVVRRHQFIAWTQSQLQALIPHQLMVCGAYQRQRRSVTFDVHHTVPLSAAALQALSDADGTLVRSVSAAWVAGRGRPLALPISLLGEAAAALKSELNLGELLVHGVSRPQRPTEIETLFMLAAAPSHPPKPPLLGYLDLLLPQLHRTWQRVVSAELDLLRPVAAMVAVPAPALLPKPGKAPTITVRERQILRWVREGKSNQQIAETLSISPLTVKNHVQKILRKLGASNRAQAVALAMDQHLLGDMSAADMSAAALQPT
jgi:transcriptional regulator EpsA